MDYARNMWVLPPSGTTANTTAPEVRARTLVQTKSVHVVGDATHGSGGLSGGLAEQLVVSISPSTPQDVDRVHQAAVATPGVSSGG
jgi:hypothetical protein